MTSALPQGLDLSKVPSMLPPPGVQPNFVNPKTGAEAIIAISATTSILGVILLSGRLYSTLRITRSAGYDDYACVAAMIFSLAYMGLNLHMMDYARHMWDMPIASFTPSVFKIIFYATICGALGLMFAKLSILLLLFRLFSPDRRFRYSIYVGIVWTTLISLTTVIVAGALCAPRKGESFDSLTLVQRCKNEEIWAAVQGALNVALDFYILYLPVPVIWKLQLGRKRKIGVLGIFMTGLAACVSSVLSVVYKARLIQNSDSLWNSWIVDILNTVEINVAIIVACMPACASFYRHFLSQSGFLSFIMSGIVSSKLKRHPKLKTTTESIGPAPDKYSEGNRLTPGSDPAKKGSKGIYWRLKDSFRQGSVPPQLTSAKRESGHILKSGDFNVFSNKRSSEREGTSFEQEEKTAAAYDVV